jgi:hypothetical protein
MIFYNSLTGQYFLIIKFIIMQRKGLGLLLAAAAAYGYYRYSKMTPEKKSQLKERGKKLMNDNLGGLGKIFRRTEPAAGSGY